MNNLINATGKISSKDLVEVINGFRIEEGNTTELQHSDFMKSIRKEIEALNLTRGKILVKNLTAENLAVKIECEESTYLNTRNQQQPCFLMSHKFALQMLNKESALVRYRTTEYIEELQHQHQPQLNHYEQAKAEIDLLGVTAKVLNLNDASKLLCVTNIYNNHGIPTNILPQYTESKGQLLSATELLKRNGINMSAVKFNKLMLEHGYLENLSRESKTKDLKIFKSLTSTGLEYGENQVSPKNPKETQVLYYADKFTELLYKLGID